MSLSRDAILAADDLPLEVVEVSEWGGSVNVRSMSGSERDAFEQSLMQSNTDNKKVNMRNIRARMVALCAVDDDGVRLFTDDDVESLGAKSAKALSRVFEVAQTLNGMGADDIEDLAEN